MFTRRIVMGGIGTAALAAGVRAQDLASGFFEPDDVFDLWPKGPPGMPAIRPPEAIDDRTGAGPLRDRWLSHIARPTLAAYRPKTPNGAAMLVMPGGGYEWVVVDKEGHDIARALAARGFAAFVLTYRLPGDGWKAGPNVALSDAQRAMRLIRAGAARYGVDAARVGAIGFSAGGHLCADLLTRHGARTYDPVDAADTLSARPKVAAPIYPVISMRRDVTHAGSRAHLIGENADSTLEWAHSAEANVTPDAPPTFLLHCEDDDVVPVENSLLLRAALKAAKVPVETHLFASGGHGFGLRGQAGKPAGAWLELFLRWAQAQGVY